jgi:DNA-binding NtrC family response regulator
MEPRGETLLIVDDDLALQEVLADRLEALGYRVVVAANGQEGLALLEKAGPQLVLLDLQLPDMSGLEVLAEIRTREAEVTVVMITAHGTVERAVQAMKAGAYDFITKPFEPDHIALTVQRALERERLKREVALLSEAVGEPYRQVVSQSDKIKEALEVAQKAALSKATVLLLGESGTGKELFARAIHDWSERRHQPFVAINCVALSKDLLESELFGHEKGAFTGADRLKKGKLEVAQGGTVFLDEIGDLAPELQAKLLRFLQERGFERVGGTHPIRADVRVIAATNRDLEGAIKEGRFREDLYYRLNVVPLTPVL